MSECTHDCSTCAENCSQRKSFKQDGNKHSRIKKVIGVVSGKGGVGKSMVTSLLAVSMQRLGFKTAILDADITGPSIPQAFGIHDKAFSTELGILPLQSQGGTKVMSINLLLEEETDPVVWRGPVIAGAVKQFWTDVVWQDVDFMFVDMPPGTGDVPLTVFQSLPVDGIVVVTTPQQLVEMIVGKAVKMAEIMHVPVLGLVENMSYFLCPNCQQRHSVFGESHVEDFAKANGISAVCKMPINPQLATLCDNGEIENADVDLDEIVDTLCRLVK